MKFHLLAFVLLSLALVGCDSINYRVGCTDMEAANFDPKATDDDGSCRGIKGCKDPEAFNFKSNATEDNGSCVYQRLLLEQFTGHLCQTCPSDELYVNELKEEFEVIRISVHAKDKAVVYDEPPFNTEHRPPGRIGEQIYERYGLMSAGSGIINRVKEGVLSGQFAPAWEEWSHSCVGKGDLEKLRMNVEITPTPYYHHDQDGVILDVDFQGNFRRNPHELRTIIWVKEDGIIAPQEDGDKTNLNFKHNDVLRSMPLGIDGQAIENRVIDGVSFGKTYDIHLDPTWKRENVEIVLGVYDAHLERIIFVQEFKL